MSQPVIYGNNLSHIGRWVIPACCLLRHAPKKVIFFSPSTSGVNKTPVLSLALAAVFVVIILSVCIILLCCCFRKWVLLRVHQTRVCFPDSSLCCNLSFRHRDIIWPNIPDPSVLFKHMMNGNSELRVQYTPGWTKNSFAGISYSPPLIALCFSDSRRKPVLAGARTHLLPADRHAEIKATFWMIPPDKLYCSNPTCRIESVDEWCLSRRAAGMVVKLLV